MRQVTALVGLLWVGVPGEQLEAHVHDKVGHWLNWAHRHDGW
ncbi:hypothetical protein [Streptomyces sp. 6-11-2]|nr:hypothetical protein [Streptomyces sp. 6-11-2]